MKIEKDDILTNIVIKNAHEHNLKNLDLNIPKNKIVVITGPSGSGKSTLAFDTVYAEGQRMYVESMSNYVKQFLQIKNKPKFDSISGLSPSIAIDQKTTARNPRSTVGTITEIYDYLRIMFARIGKPYSPTTGRRIVKYSSSEIIHEISNFPENSKIRLCSPVVIAKTGNHATTIMMLLKNGLTKIKVNGMLMNIDPLNIPDLDPSKEYTIEAIIDRVIIKKESRYRIADSVEKCLRLSDGFVSIDIVDLPENHENILIKKSIAKIKKGESFLFSEKIFCKDSDFVIEEIEPKLFSFNSPNGLCKECNGIGVKVAFDESLIIPDTSKSINEGCISPWEDESFNKVYYLKILKNVCRHYNVSMDTPYKDLTSEFKNILLHGSNGVMIDFEINESGLKPIKVKKSFNGIFDYLVNSESDEKDLDQYKKEINCHLCQGHRLNKQSLSVKINDLNIGQVSSMDIIECQKWIDNLKNELEEDDIKISDRIIKEIDKRLNFLKNVGLEYLSINRKSNTLSGGEAQRIRLASQIGSGLSGVIYVLDEPSIGLHQSDNTKLIETLKKLRDLGNTVIVVEHDEETMIASDYIFDIGHTGGENGGYIVAKGTPEEVMKNKDSITGQFLSNELLIPLPEGRRKYGKNKAIKIKNVNKNNVQNVDLNIPLGKFISVTGVSGSGKSTLIMDIFYKAMHSKLNGSHLKSEYYSAIENYKYIDKIIIINQSPIGRTPRSNPITYIGVFTYIREWFASLSESKIRGYKASRFSFNVKGGRCESCKGDGVVKVEMHFLPDVYIKCNVCKGKRFDRETLEVKYNGKNIADVLDMTVEEGYKFFNNLSLIKDKLKSLIDVGLEYIKLGQPSNTLSGGEAQRIKLSKELSKAQTGDTLYILDEPTTGLHNSDIIKLLGVLHQLVDYGNTMIVIEHNLSVIKTSDHVIDMGPKGGKDGGKIIAEGTPEEIALNKESITGLYLKKELDRHKVKKNN